MNWNQDPKLNELLQQACNGSAATKSELLEYLDSQHKPAIMGQLKFSCVRGQDLEDSYQDVVVCIHEQIEQIKSPRAFRKWLWGVERSTARKYWIPCEVSPRSEKDDNKHADPAENVGNQIVANQHAPQTTTILLSTEVQEAKSRRCTRFESFSDLAWSYRLCAKDANIEKVDDVRWAIESLPPRWGTVIRLKYFEGYTCAEVAQKLRCSTKRAYKLLQKGRERLKSSLSVYAPAAAIKPEPKPCPTNKVQEANDAASAFVVVRPLPPFPRVPPSRVVGSQRSSLSENPRTHHVS